MRQEGKNPKGPNGFTLAELILVLAILAIMAALVIPLSLGTSDFQAVSAARMIAADLQYAQNMAITSQNPVTVTFDTSGESYSLSNESGLLIHPINKTEYTIIFPSRDGFEKLDVVSSNFDGSASVTFDELGAPDNAGVVVLQAGVHIYRVEVAAATGRVTVASDGS